MQRKRFKMQIETSTSCVGTCTGCALTSAQRLSQVPVLQDTKSFFERLSGFYSESIRILEDDYHEYCEYVVVELGVGEHFNFTNDYIQDLAVNLKAFLERTGRKYIVSLSTSGLLPVHKMEEKLNILNSVIDKENLEIQLVVNLNAFEKYEKKYHDALDLFQKHSSFQNILINFDNQLPLENCEKFAKLLTKYAITDFQLVYGLKQHNMSKVGFENKLFYDVYREILKHAPVGYRQYDIRKGAYKFFNKKEEISIHDAINQAVSKCFNVQAFIDYEGKIYSLIYTMIGGIELDERAGFSSDVSIWEPDAAKKYFELDGKIKRELLKTYVTSEVCQECPYKGECYSAGVPLMAKSLINAKEGKCYNPLMHFYSNAQEILSNYVDNDPTDFEAKCGV